MSAVDEAVQKAYLKAWEAPSVQSSVPADKRNAALHISIGRDGTVLATTVHKTAGTAALDASLLQVAERVRKIPVSLPASYPKTRYDLQVNFQIE
jgi:hypothetical protein